jgi:hypothetical protein
LGAANRQQRTALRAAATVIFALGIVNQLDEWARNLVPDRQVRYERAQITALSNWIAVYAKRSGWNQPTISF